MRYTKTQSHDALDSLKEILFPGDKIHTIVTHVSRSGMSRSIRVLLLRDGHRDISYLVARVLDETMDDNNGGVKVTGCGMDMGFDIIYRLGYHLFPDGFTCIGKDDTKHPSVWCPSSDHVNGDRDYTPHTHKSGGYAFRQEWL